MRLGGFAEGVHAAAFAGEVGDVHIREDQAVFPAGFRQALAVFVDQIVPGKDGIHRGFALARVGVHIAAHQPRGLALQQQAAVVRLAHQLVGGAGVGDDGGPGQRVRHAGRVGHPKVLADFDAQAEFGHVDAAEQQIRAKGHAFAVERDVLRLRRAGREMAQFIVFGVIGQVRFGRHAQHAALVDHGRAVVQAVAHRQRQARDGHDVQRLAGPAQFLQRVQRAAQQRVLEHQIAHRVAC